MSTIQHRFSKWFSLSLIARVALYVAIAALLYSRFVNLSWGLPYPMHPDERNMVDAMLRLRCENPAELVKNFLQALGAVLSPDLMREPVSATCMNPAFFAYGQFSLYVAFFIAKGIGYLSQDELSYTAGIVSFSHAALALRLIAAASSVATVWYIVRTVRLLRGRLSKREHLITVLIATFVPVAIQMAHFGTTESLLALLYIMLTYHCMQIVHSRRVRWQNAIYMGILTGIALGVKVSAVPYLAVPLCTLAYLFCAKAAHLYRIRSQIDHLSVVAPSTPPIPTLWPNLHGALKMPTLWKYFGWLVWYGVLFGLMMGVWALLASPYNLILSQQLQGSMAYESSVGVGQYIPFYTRQFLLETPLLFQMHRVFPYALGNPLWLLTLVGCCVLSWRSRMINMVRLAMVVMLFSNGLLYAKWTRFLAPMYPLLTVVGIVFLLQIFHAQWLEKLSHRLRLTKYVLWAMMAMWVILPGVGYLSVYNQTDPRYEASAWMYRHIAPNSQILSETANVVDVPLNDERSGVMRPPTYNAQSTSFDFYELDSNSALQDQLQRELASADYIIIPSRRIFYNLTCRGEISSGQPTRDTWVTTRHSPEKCAYLKKTYPQLDRYYDELFSGKSGFKKIAEFSSYPRISLGGLITMSFPDEEAEETFTVFDHPVLRVYERVR